MGLGIDFDFDFSPSKIFSSAFNPVNVLANPTLVGGAATLAAPLVPVEQQRKQRKMLEQQAASERAMLARLMAQKTAALPDQEALQRARRRSLVEQFRRRGRASTILSDQIATDPLGE